MDPGDGESGDVVGGRERVKIEGGGGDQRGA